METKDILPIGSVVMLTGGVRKIMVTGIEAIRETEPDKVYDYIGVLYPEGYLSNGFQVLFDHVDIDEVYFVGYSDSLRDQYLELLGEKSEPQ